MPILTTATLGKFCRELAAGLSSLDVLLHEWGLTHEQYAALAQSEGYRYEMTVIAQEMREMGADAGYIYRMKSLSEEFVQQIVAIMHDLATPTATKVDLIKFCAEMARLKEKPMSAAQAAAGPRGPSVVFQFGPGLPVQTIKVVGDEIDDPTTLAPPTPTHDPAPSPLPVPRRGFQLVDGSVD